MTGKDNSSPAQKNKNTTIFTFHYWKACKSSIITSWWW